MGLNSQNVATKGYCTGGNTGNGDQPNNKAQCEQTNGAVWHEVQPFGIAKPQCVTAKQGSVVIGLIRQDQFRGGD